ncbi:MAG: alcohol dehydrogenase-like regulatory protein ErcA [Pseudomonadota bacterium]
MTSRIELELRKFVAPEFVFGDGARLLTGQYARNLGAFRVLVVTDPGVMEAGWTGDVIKSLEQEGLSCTLFCDVTPNPTAEQAMAGAAAYLEGGCNAIVAVGGGSPMDCAKAIGIVNANGGHILQYEGVDKPTRPVPPLICVPTTAGSSADVSQFAIITDVERRVKIAIVSKTIVPDAALIDPRTTTTMGAELTAHTGMDAFCHATEAYVSNANSAVTDAHALEAIRLISESLRIAVSDTLDIQARGKMMLGSLFAGLAFSNAGLGAVHAMAHSLGGLLDLPHGECNAILLEHVIRLNFASAPERYRNIAAILGSPVETPSEEDATESLVASIAELRRSVGVDASLGQMGMRYEDIPELAVKAARDPCLVTNPAVLDRSDIEKAYERAF